MEKFELLDKDGNKTGKIITSPEIDDKSLIPQGYYVAIVGVLIINNENEVLLERRSKLKKIDPGKWGICGGKIDYNEDPITAGIRETYEEIGVLLNKDEMKMLCVNKSETAYFNIFYVRKNIDINDCKLQKEEVDELRYFNIEKLGQLYDEGVEWLKELKKVLY